jgi:hypothetical protein
MSWGISLLFLLLSILSAFIAMWLRDQGMININNHFDKCLVDSKLIKILEKTAWDVADWQKKILDVRKNKATCLIVSSCFFGIALIIIVVSSFYLFF